MKHGINGLDHPVIAVADMAAARAAYENLGFTVPPRGRHREWGTGNWCIMLADDYLELRGILDASRYLHGLDRFLDRGEGLMGIAFGTDSAESSHAALTGSGFHPRPVKQLTRLFELPESIAEPSFALCFLEEEETPALGSVVFCQHRTPHIIRRPEWLRHANTAQGIRALIIGSEQVEAFARTADRLFGHSEAAEGGVAVRLPRGCTLGVIEPAAFDARFPGATADTPLRAAITLNVTSLEAARQALESGGVRFHRQDERLRVPADQACGVVLEFSA